MKKRYLTLFLPLMVFQLSAQHKIPHSAETPLADIIGLMHSSGKYHFTTNNFMKEGVDEIVGMGTHVIKLFFGRNSQNAYPSYWGCDWDTYSYANLTELAQTPYFEDAFSRPQLKTYILSAHEMSNGGSITNFKNGLSVAEKNNLYNELYDLATYLYTIYQGTGKTFVLANWEGDGILGFVDRQDNLPPADTAQMWLNGFTDWLNIRQDAITAARRDAQAAGKTNVLVVGAAECNHVNIRSAYAWPTMIDSVIPRTHMDLYSFSNWKTNKPSTVDDFDSTLHYIKAKAPDSELFGEDNLYLGEIGTFELVNLVGNIPAHTTASDRVAREVMQRNIEYALKFGIRYIAHWQIFDNGLRSGVVLPEGQNAVESQLTGTGIRRADGSYAGTYNYYKSIMSRTIGDYINIYEAEAQVTSPSGGNTEVDTRFNSASGEYFSKFNATAVGDSVRYTLHISQTGTCNVRVGVRKGPSYGRFRLSIGQEVIDSVIDCYNSGSNIFAEYDLGAFTFDSTGVYEFSCKVTGKTGSAYSLGLDYFKITPASPTAQHITFAPLEAKGAGDVPFVLGASATSGLPVSYVSSNPRVAVVQGAGREYHVTVLAPGTTTITASQSGNNDYAAAGPVAQTLLVLDSSGMQAAEIIVDNTSASFSTQGTWSVSTSSADKYGTNYAHDGTSGADAGKWAKWVPDVAVAGLYKVAMIWNGGTSRPQAAPVTIAHAGGIDSSLKLDQQFRAGLWNELGVYEFSPGTAHYVQIYCSSPGYTIADAVKFTLMRTAAPEGLTAADSAGTSASLSWNSVSGATGYNVYSAEAEGGPFVKENTLPVTGTVYYAAGVAPDRYFRVSALSAYGESGLSAFASAAVKLPQTISFNAIPERTVDDLFILPGATATSGLPVRYHSTDTSVAAVRGDTLILEAPGTAIITASQPGNENYLVAADVQQLLVVTEGSVLLASIKELPVVSKAPADVSITLFPNPARDYLMVQGRELADVKSVQVVSLTGATMAVPVTRQADNRSRLDIRNLPAGVYILVLKTGQGVQAFKFAHF